MKVRRHSIIEFTAAQTYFADIYCFDRTTGHRTNINTHACRLLSPQLQSALHKHNEYSFATY